MDDIIHKPTKSEFKRMAAQLGYEQVVHGRGGYPLRMARGQSAASAAMATI